MGIMQRFKDIMSSNINALLDKAEDPEKMIDQYVRNLEDSLGQVKSETASVMAEEKRAKRELDECTSDIEKMQTYAEKALTAGNEADAKKFLEQKQNLVSKQVTLQQGYATAQANAEKMRQMYDKLTSDLNKLHERKANIKAKVQVAKAQEKVNQMTNNIPDVSGTMSAFDRMEAKADQMLDKANAESELNVSTETNTVEDLADKYDSAPSASVDDELAALKAKMGIQ